MQSSSYRSCSTNCVSTRPKFSSTAERAGCGGCVCVTEEESRAKSSSSSHITTGCTKGCVWLTIIIARINHVLFVFHIYLQDLPSQCYLFWTVVVSTCCSVLCFLLCLLLQRRMLVFVFVAGNSLNAQTHTLYMCDVTAMDFHKCDHFGCTTPAVSKEAPPTCSLWAARRLAYRCGSLKAHTIRYDKTSLSVS